MAKGVVKTFNQTRGYGFITPADGGPDLHVLGTAVLAGGAGSLKEGDTVEYTPGEGPKGPRASDVRVISGGGGGGCCNVEATSRHGITAAASDVPVMASPRSTGAGH